MGYSEVGSSYMSGSDGSSGNSSTYETTNYFHTTGTTHNADGSYSYFDSYTDKTYGKVETEVYSNGNTTYTSSGGK